MKAGQKLVASDGHEVCLFPCTFMQFSQIGPWGSYSHCCGHAMDIATSQSQFPLYAPFSMHRVGTIPSENGFFYASDNPVWTPAGLQTVTIDVMHDCNTVTQTSFAQGELFAHSGVCGTATGDHSHVEAAFGVQTTIGYGGACSGGGTCYMLNNAQAPETVFYINDTQIINDYGLSWKTYQGGSSPTVDMQAVLEWVYNTCNRADVGYSQTYRNQQTVNGITYYDCSSFINYALLAGGASTPSYAPNNNAFVTWNMGAELERLGFKVVTDGTLKAGDIGVSNNATSQHTEICYTTNGNNIGQWAGAHSPYVPLQDQVSITPAWRGNWFDVLYRYEWEAPDPPPEPTPTKKKMPLWMMINPYLYYRH